jgi:hypothetical protein
MNSSGVVGAAVERVIGGEGQGHVRERVQTARPGETERRLADLAGAGPAPAEHHLRAVVARVRHQRDGEIDVGTPQHSRDRLARIALQDRLDVAHAVDVEDDQLVLARRQAIEEVSDQRGRRHRGIHHGLEGQQGRQAVQGSGRR